MENEKMTAYWREYVTKIRIANGMSERPSFGETVRHAWCMLAHGARQKVDEIHPQSTGQRISCAKCRVWWIEPKC
jgi:hypothetical protein